MNSLPGISNDGEESYCQPGDEPDILIVRRGHHRNWSHSSPASPRPRLLLKRTVGFPHNTLLFVCVLWQTEDTCNTSCVCCDKVRTRATLHVCVVTNWGNVQHFMCVLWQSEDTCNTSSLVDVVDVSPGECLRENSYLITSSDTCHWKAIR